MPVLIPVIAAAGAIGFAASGIAAYGITMATALEATAALGATLGAVGAISRDKGLTTAGMVLGAVGGVGALAANAGLLGADATTAPLFGDAASGAADAASAAGTVAPDAATVTPIVSNTGPGIDAGTGSLDATAAGAQSGDIIDQLSGMPSGSAASAGEADAASTMPPPILGDTESPTVPAAAAGPLPATNVPPPSPVMTPQAAQAAGSVAPVAPGLPGGADVSGTASFDAATGTWTTGAGGFAAPEPSILQSLLHNQWAQFGMVSSAGSLISGLTNPVTPAQIDAMNAQASANRAGASLTNAQVANMQGGMPVASLKPVTANVTGKPAPTVPGGLINTVPPPTVTGAPI